MSSHRPPQDVQEAADRARRWIEEGHAGEGFTDTGRVAWDAWGGDPGRRWARTVLEKGDR